MKKTLCLVAILLLLVGVILSERAIAQPKTNLTKDNLTLLEGTWEGSADFAVGVSVRLVLVINNNSLPLEGKISFLNIPVGRADLFPGRFSGSTYEGNFDNGTITNKGDLIITGQGGNFGEFSLSKDQKKLTGWFYLWGARGTMTLKKK